MLTEAVDRVISFHEALELAIYDRELEEKGAELVFYYDADVVFETVIGLTSWNPAQPLPDVSALKYVVRALLSTGFLPTIHLLPPHLAEFGQILRQLPSTAMTEGFHRATMSYLVQVWQLAETDEDLRSRLETADGFYDFLREHGYGVFVKLELCLGGTWLPRLKRMLRDGQFRLAGSELPDPGDPAVEAFARILSEFRSARPLNNVSDAYALAMLARRVERGTHARFYTDTEVVRRALRSPELRDRIRMGDGHSVERTEEYFLIRSSFPALWFADVALSPNGAATSLPLHELKQLCSHLGEILRDFEPASLPADTPGAANEEATKDAALLDALRQETVGGMRIDELIDRFNNLGFLKSVFLSWSPAEMEAWLPSLTKAKSDATVLNRTRRRLGMSLDVLWATIDREIGQLRDWRQDFLTILRAAEERAQYADGRVPDLNVYLGLGRWGITQMLEPGIVERVRNGIESLLDDRVRAVSASHLALRTYRTADVQEFALQICLWWFLRLDDLILHTFAKMSAARVEPVPPWLDLFRLISLAHTASERSNHHGRSLEDELASIVRQAEQNVQAAKREGAWGEGYALMGLASVCFWAWRAKAEESGGLAGEWARRSFSAAEAAADVFERGSLGWAFAVNHCAMMGVRAGVFPERTEQYVTTLIEAIPRQYDHYRFADTIARYFTTRARGVIEQHGIEALASDPSLSELRRAACEDLRYAKERLQRFPSGGDPEVVSHVYLIEHHLSALRCGRSSEMLAPPA
jgi:hypothetical protein